MSASILGLQISQLALARGTAAFLGCVQASMGLFGVADPVGAAKAFGVPSKSPMVTDRNLYIRVTGGTRLAGGIGMLVCLYFGENRAVALNMLAACFVGVVDAMSLRGEVAKMRMTREMKSPEELKELEDAESKAWGHMMAGPMAVGVGAWLFSVSR